MTDANEWSRAFLDLGRRAGGWPRYGSPEWQQLDPRDDKWFAAVVHAAECWRDHCDPVTIARQLTDELGAQRYLQGKAQRDADDTEARQLTTDVRRRADIPPFVELQRRRGVAA